MAGELPDGGVQRALPQERCNGDAARLVGELLALGFEPALVPGEFGFIAGGLGFECSVRRLVAEPGELEHLATRVRELLLMQVPVTVALTDVGLRGERRLERVLRRLARAVSSACIDDSKLAIAVNGGLPSLLPARRAAPGSGPCYALLDDGASGRDDSELWSLLYQLRGRQRAPEPVVGGVLNTRCPLLSEEHGAVPVSCHVLPGPPQAAFLPIAANLRRQRDRHGRLDEATLHRRFERALDLADLLFDRLCWPDARQRRDARDNRRIVFVLQGLGDLAGHRDIEPAGMHCLRDLDRLVGDIHSCLWERSRRLAGERGMLPALAGRDPGRAMADGRERRAWRRRWQAALANAAVRHRNLLAISPFALARGGAAADALDLMPLLAHADVVSFAGPRDFTGLRIADFRAFYLRAAAVIRRRDATAFVATGV